MNKLLSVLIFSFLFFECHLLLAEDNSSKKWPEVLPMHKIIHFVAGQNSISKIKIMGKNGKPLYLLESHLNAWALDDDNDFNYSGDFESRLTSLYDNYFSSTLLTNNPNPTRDWDSRGRFLMEDIMGKSADYPEYGRLRHFRLRGMELTLNIRSIEISHGAGLENGPRNEGKIRKLELEITVVPDSTAKLGITEKPKYD